VAVTVGVPADDGVKVTEHAAWPPPPVGAHDPAENEPWPPADHVTVPPGVVATPASVSVTVAVHSAGEPTTTELSHCTAVDV